MKIAIIGGGIGGLAAAVGLQKLGLDTQIYERAQSFKPLGAGIGIGSNAMLALRKLGVADDTLQSGIPLYEQRFLNGDFKVMNTIDFTLLKKRFGEENIAIQRADLHESLYNAINVNTLHFNKKVEKFNQTDEKVSIRFTDGTTEEVDYLIAADGINSIFRQTLLPGSKPRYAGYTCWRGITKNANDVTPHISSEAWSKKGRFGWSALKNGDVYWFACINAKENNTYYKNLNKGEVAEHFEHLSPIIKRLIAETKDYYYLHHDIYDIKPLSNYVFKRICLLGDAAHATTPNMGQGAGQSIEDAFELMNSVEATSSIPAAFKLYNDKRLKKTRKVVRLSRQIGVAAQWENPILVGFRNTFFPFIPKSLLFWRLTFLFK